MNAALVAFLHGAAAMGFLVAAFYFARAWKASLDRFFAIFAVAFGLMAANRLAFVFVDQESEAGTVLFVIRLLSYLLIIVAVVDRNVGRHTRR